MKTNQERRHNPADMHKRKLDPRLYDDEFAELNRRVLREVLFGVGLIYGLIGLLYVVARYVLA